MTLVKLMKGTGRARKIEKQLDQGGLPAFALLDAAGAVLASWRGYRDAGGFIARLGEAMARAGSSGTVPA